MNELKIFKNREFGQIRTVEIDGKPYFVGKDVATALGYKDTTNALKQHCRGVVKHHLIDNLGRNQEVNVITEGDIYRLVVKSQLPSAEKFENWVFDEVLPSIRKHGMYAKDELLDNPDLLISVATELKAERARSMALKSDNERMRPKEVFADAVATSHTSILIGDLAKLLKQNGVDIGQKRFFEWLRNNGYLIRRKGNDWNMPTQRAMEMELFEVKESTVNNPDGSVRINRTTKVTGKGQQYFINRFLGKEKKSEED